MDNTTKPIELSGEKSYNRLKKITERLEQGVTELFDSRRYKEYLRVMSRFHNYSFNNTMLIYLQKPDATRLAGYQTWKKFRRHVKKGEKSIKVIAPAPYKKTVEENGEEKVIVVPHFKVVSAFDVSQTEGKPLPEITTTLTGSVEGCDVFLSALEQVSPYSITFEDFDKDAYGFCDYQERHIVVRPGLNEAQTIKTAIHEIAHAWIHDNHNPVLEDEAPKFDKRTREVQAESIAFACCEHFGLDSSDYSIGYIAGWSSGRELKELHSSLEIIRNTAAEIIGGVEEQLLELRQEHGQEEESPGLAMSM